jgi:dTDP-4-amino-4,6-dideoxygalactose transaminase
MDFKTVEQFEQALAEYFGAPYAVATDSCTHAVELCLRYEQPFESVGVPQHTYVSIPMTMEKLGITWHWTPNHWKQHYRLDATRIYDAAVYWRRGGYIDYSLMCLSFQHKKALSLGRGGAILCSELSEYNTLKRMSYDGRNPHEPWAQQQIETLGYHYYMTPETAHLGLQKLPEAHLRDREWSYADYPDVSLLPVFT